MTIPTSGPRRDRWSLIERAWAVLALPIVLAALQLVGTHLVARWQPERRHLDAVSVLLLVGGPLALAGRRRYPVVIPWLVSGIALLYMLLGYPYGPVLLSVIVALYAAVMAGRRITAWLTAASLYGGHFGFMLLLRRNPAPTWMEALGVGAWLLAGMAAFEIVRVRRERTLAARRTREEEERRRASEERLNIARELHDVLAHHISLINVQAGVALHLLDRRPEQGRIALTAIEAASREAMTELRSVLTILSRPDEAAPRAPAPSLSRLEGLVGQTAAAGIEVRTEVEGERRPLAAPIDAAAFRIVQEALTNVVRHARATTATVRICYGPRDITVEVDDDGESPAKPAATGGGNGIPGMRERAHALGGELDAGRRSGRGFRVRARLPADPVP